MTPIHSDRLGAVPPSGGPALPSGWHQVDVAAVGRPLLVGPGGVFVLFARDTAAVHDRSTHDDGDRRAASSGAQLTAELVSQMLGHAVGRAVACTPVVVIDDTAVLATRPDLVPVLHHTRLAAWLQDLPVVHDDAAVLQLSDSLLHV